MRYLSDEDETVFNLVTLLQGRAWDCVEDLTVEDLAKPEAYATVFERLDAAFKFDAMTELPSDFESYLVKMQRKNGQTFLGVSGRVPPHRAPSDDGAQDRATREDSSMVVSPTVWTDEGSTTADTTR